MHVCVERKRREEMIREGRGLDRRMTCMAVESRAETRREEKRREEKRREEKRRREIYSWKFFLTHMP
jgi:hypothetical protein